MAPLEPAADAIVKKVLEQLSRTPYACSSLSQLSTRPGNYVYRGMLLQPTLGSNSAETVIIKHTTNPDTPYQGFEKSLLNSLAKISPVTASSAVIQTPRLYLFSQETNIQVLEDFTNTDSLRAFLFSPATDLSLPQSSPAAIGRSLGLWLRSFHTWASAPEQSPLQEQMWQHDPMRKVKYDYTYGSFVEVLGHYPELLRDHENALTSVQDAIAKELDKPSTERDEGWGIIHGDFWSGNILLPTTIWHSPKPSDLPDKIFTIDWEFAQFGHRSYDLGQIVGDLFERKMYNKLDTALDAMKGVIAGYGELTEDMAFRTAIYVGVHLISWYNRRPRKGPRVASTEAIVAGLTVGRDFVVKGWERDRLFFESSVLASLFPAR
ncbi:hypothetical protein BR93DRAFT_881392 [Coniochaeta sp. PMI_546]|nr:hypothetical protein BR93DRAFT_881392 [Coniochaeta sp. PMI_546]